MAYFDCIVGGSGKGNTLVVTCADDLAGATITCTNGTKTYTKTCPSTAPYEVTFYGLAAGTYTVSATVSGNTYTTTVVVTDYEAELGGFNWRAWVDLSKNYTSSDFADLNELLDTELAVRELMTIHACVDYLAGIAAESPDVETIIGNDLCAKWINNRDYALDTLYANEIIAGYMDAADKYFYGEWALMPQVPTMTSNTAPYGTAHATSMLSSLYDAYKAFTGNSSDYWVTNTSDGFIWFDFPHPVCVKKLLCRTNTETDESIINTIVASNDNGSTYDEIDTFTDHTTTLGEQIEVSISNENYYLSWGIKIGTRFHYGLSTLQFYAYAPKGNVPVMTSNTAPYGEASASNTYGSYYPYNVFDGNPSTLWSTNNSVATNYLEYDFVNPVCARQIRFIAEYVSRVGTIVIKGSNDKFASDSHDLVTINGSELADNVEYRKSFDNNSYYLSYRLVINYAVQYGVSIKSLQFYGRELSVSVPKMDTNTTPYGEAIASSNQYDASSFDIYRAFDKVEDATGWYAMATDNSAWIGYKFKRPACIKTLNIISNSYGFGSSTLAFDIEGSNDGITWTKIGDGTLTGLSTTATRIYHEESFDINNNDMYLYYRINFGVKIVYSGTSFVIVTELQFYGLDYSEKEFEEGTTKKWLFDHGLELETFNAFQQGSNGVTEKRNDELYFAGGSDNTGFRIASAINLSAFSLLRWKVGDEHIPNSNGYDSVNVRTSPTSSVSAYARIGMDLPNNGGFDISNINSTMYVQVNTTGNGKDTIKEWWLE